MSLKIFLGRGLALALFVVSAAAGPYDVSIETPEVDDPLILQGDWLPPRAPGLPVLIGLHGLGSSREEWRPLVEAAARRGWGAYIYDARGHGRSRATLSGQAMDHEEKRFGRNPAFWRAMPEDLRRVVANLETQKGVTAKQRVLTGASLGANACLLAAGNGVECAGLVLLSPGIEYAGLNVEDVMGRLAAPALIVSAKPDLYAHTSSERLLSLSARPGFVSWKALEKGTPRGAHGTQLFDGPLEEQILDWVAGATHQPPVRRSAPTSRPKPKR